jgi:hypothetical protein
MKKFSPNWIWFVSIFIVAGFIAGAEEILDSPSNIIALAFFFPFGIAQALPPMIIPRTSSPLVISFIGDLIYAGLIILGSVRKSVLCFVVFVALLLLNIAGCRSWWSYPPPGDSWIW